MQNGLNLASLRKKRSKMGNQPSIIFLNCKQPGQKLGDQIMNIEVPKINEILKKIENVRAEISGKKQSITDWRQEYLKQLPLARESESIDIFNTFASALLERAMSGETYEYRIEIFEEIFKSFADVTEQNTKKALSKASYRFPEQGLSVVLAAKKIITSPDFKWKYYFEEAERKYRNDFQQDKFLGIKYVKYKTRDFALSEFSNRFVAIDLHVSKVAIRTGLFIHGYGDPKITTDYRDEQGYLFLHGLLLKLSEETGWPGNGYSPGEIDRMFWFFGRTICKAKPSCENCPVASICLTARMSSNRSITKK